AYGVFRFGGRRAVLRGVEAQVVVHLVDFLRASISAVKYPKGIAKNMLVGIGKFVFPVDFIILDMPEDIKEFSVAQRWLKDNQPEEKINTACLVKKHEKKYQIGWKIKTGNVLDSCNLRNIGFNKSGEYKKTFISSGVGMGSMQVLHGFEFEVEPFGDHTFELARDRDQHLAFKLFGYKEDSTEAAFAVAVVEKIYVHESLTFSNTFAYEATKGLLDKAKGNVLGMEIIRDHIGNTLRVSQSRFYNEKLVQTLLEGHSILSLEGILSGDCDVEKNGKWSCIHVIRSQEYQMVCMRLDITSADVSMFDKFNRRLQTDIQVFVDLTMP
nr:zinc finger, CCHC-type [Tanacetum cinerariifolium]